ncbi:MAG: tRNA pseudouridine(13) synthase TruD [Thermoplasmata archaeon]
MEEAIGISVFFTDPPGIGGKLRRDPEDFVVEEIPSGMKEETGGRYTVAKVMSRNWETNRLVRRFARTLGVSRKRIRFAGTKDKRALTTQYFQFDLPKDRVKSLRLRDVRILNVFETNEKLEIGKLHGNRFRVVIRDIGLPIQVAVRDAERIRKTLIEAGGFPNFFGLQRFGAVRPITHLVGKHIIHGDFESAVMTYIANPIEGEPEEAFQARKALQEDRDFASALKNFPDKLSFEKAVLNHLVRFEDDFIGALNQLPENLLLMFIHAYQSFLFNRILSRRMERGLPLNDSILGDYVLPLNKYGLPDHDRWILVNKRNLQKISAQVRKRKAFVSAVLFGSESIFSEGEMGEIEREIISEEGVEREDFIIPKMRKLSSKGTRREVLAPLTELEIEREEDSIVLRFQLNKGCYATSLLREFMKTEATHY